MCDLWLFFNLKERLRSRRFMIEDEVDEAMHLFIEAASSRSQKSWYKIPLYMCLKMLGKASCNMFQKLTYTYMSVDNSVHPDLSTENSS